MTDYSFGTSTPAAQRDQFESAFRNLHKNQSEKSLDILLEWYNHGTQDEPDWGYYSLAARDAFLWWQASREALKAEQEGAWIACSERMPQDGEDADGNAFGSLVLYEAGKEPNGGFNIGVWNNTYLRKWWRGYITHWMPLPAPPSQPHPIDTTSQQYETLAKGEKSDS